MCFQRILQIVRFFTCGYWNISFEKELLTMADTSTLKCVLPLDKWSNYWMLFCYYEKQTKLYFSDYNKTITHGQKHNMINV